MLNPWLGHVIMQEKKTLCKLLIYLFTCLFVVCLKIIEKFRCTVLFVYMSVHR